MKKKRISFSIMTLLAFCFLTPALAENLNLPSSQGISVEFTFVSEKPDPNCNKIISEDAKVELFLEKQPQFSIDDLDSVKMIIYKTTQQDKRKSLILKGKGGKFEPPVRIRFKFTEEARQKLAKLTSENIGRRLAIVISGKLIMAPVITEPITEGEIEVWGGGITKEYAEGLTSRVNFLIELRKQQIEKSSNH